MKRYLLVILTLILSFEISAREVYSLNNGWRFFFGDAVSSDLARQVTLPHVWNADGNQSKTIGNYMRSLDVPSEWQGRRVFIRFYGAASVADLSVNSRYVGTHRGAATAFTFEITDYLRYGMPNSIRVQVDNAQRNDLLPLAQEENRYGGLHRSVELIVTDRVAVSPLHYSTDGVFVTPEKVNAESVTGKVAIHLTTDRYDRPANVQMAILSPELDTVFIDDIRTKIDGKSDKMTLNVPFTINSPQLWCDKAGEQPLYSIIAKVSTNTTVDSVAVKTGFRSISIGNDHLLRINGNASRIRGVAMYNDRAGVGSALRSEHIAEDISLISEIGANMIRMVTSPAASGYLDECDRRGIGVWCDIPLVNSPFLADVPYTTSPALAESGREQLREIIAQNYNRPSVLMWGIFSKLVVPGDDPRPYIRELNSLAKNLDSSRPTVAVSNQDGDINFITDMIVWHQALGWQTGDVQDVHVWKEQLREGWSNLRSGLTYSAGGSPQHQDSLTVRPRLDRNWHPERWQTIFHESYMRSAGNDP
ncbi:MAG: beta-galactosidase, partial [Rikenellaceae bacterium]|nr:beta-galactosidase [Rikenellaceae bacterium]